MSNKNFSLLVVVTVILVVIAFFMAGQSGTTELGFQRGQPLMDYFDTEKLTRVEIKKGEDHIVAVKRGDQFLVENRSMYPADGGRINDLIKKCQEVKCMREVTESKDAHADLGVAEASEDALVVKFMGGDKVLTGLIVGNEADKGEYIREVGSDTVYTSEAKMFLSTDPLEFVNRTVCEIPRERTQRCELVGNGQPVSIKKDKSDKAVIEGVPEGMVEQAGMGDRILHVLSLLSFTDFKSETELKDLDFKHTYRCFLDSHERYVFKLAKKGDKWYAKTTAAYTGPKSLTAEQVKKGEKDDKIQKRNERILQAGPLVAKYNARHQSWVYELDNWVAENMTKAFADMIEEQKEFLKIEEKTLKTVSVTPFGGKPYTIESPKAGEVNLVGIPEKKKAKGFDHQLVFTAGKNLRWDEHKKPDDAAVKDLKFTAKHTTTLRDGQEYTFDMAKDATKGKEMDRWVKAAAKYVGNGEGEAAVLAKAAVKKFNDRHGKRVYKVASVDSLVRQFSSLVVDADARPEEIQASHILIAYKGAQSSTATRSKEEAKKLADDLYKQVTADPAKLADLAKQHSDCTTKSNGGDLGRFRFEKMTKPFSEAAFKLNVGQLSGVVETEFGYHIIKRTK